MFYCGFRFGASEKKVLLGLPRNSARQTLGLVTENSVMKRRRIINPTRPQINSKDARGEHFKQSRRVSRQTFPHETLHRPCQITSKIKIIAAKDISLFAT